MVLTSCGAITSCDAEAPSSFFSEFTVSMEAGMLYMFWVGIIGDELVGPFRVSNGTKKTAITYINFAEG